MAIYKLDVEKKFGQLRFRLSPQGGPAADFSAGASDMTALIAALDAALVPLDIDGNVDSVIFRGIEYTKKVALRETVRLSHF